MNALQDTAVIHIDVVDELTLDDIGHIGPVARTFALQSAAAAAQRKLDYIREDLARQIEDQERQAASAGHMGSLTPAYERIAHHPDVIAAKAAADAAAALVTVAQEEIGGVAFCVADDKLRDAHKKIEALSRKAVKIECEPITLTSTDETVLLNYCYFEEEHRGHHATFQHTFVILKGSTPRVPGFEFLATVTTTEAGNVIKTVPAIRFGIRHNIDFGHTHEDERHSAAAKALDAIDLTRFYTTGDICEHCHKHRGRVDTFIVYNHETGETKQVGRQCLRDFTGINDPMRIVKILQQVWEAMRTLSFKGQTPPLLTTEYLAHCATMIRVDGGYRKANDYYGSTKQSAFTNIYNQREQRKDQKTGEPLWVDPTDADRDYARTIRNWVINEWTETGDFPHNVKVAVTPEVLNPKIAGFAAAAFVAWQNAQARKATQETEEKTEKVVSQHVGTIGNREVFTLTLVDVKWIEDRYRYNATNPLLIMEDEKGNSVKWFARDFLPEIIVAASKDEADEKGIYYHGILSGGTVYRTPVVGGTYKVKATVNKHEDHPKFGKSTLINRCKFEAIVSEPEIDDEEAA